jgi:uncharacterized protein (TIGR02594 family)
MTTFIVPSVSISSPALAITDDNSAGFDAQADASAWPNDYLPSLRDGDLPTGFSGAPGGAAPYAGNSNQTVQPINVPPKDTLWESLDYVLTEAQNRDWRERGSPPNPNINACYNACGITGYTRDGGPIKYAWCAGFVTYALDTAGIEHMKSMGSQTYRTYGNPVDWRGNLQAIRKWDICVFKSRTRSGGHIGFVAGIDYNSRTIKCLGGNQNDNLNTKNYSINSPSTGRQYLVEIRRNWDIPPMADFPFGDSRLIGEESRTV